KSALIRFIKSRFRNLILPDVTFINRSTARPSVDFPEPDSPTNPSVSPADTSKFPPLTARRIFPVLILNSTFTFSTRSIGTDTSGPSISQIDSQVSVILYPAISKHRHKYGEPNSTAPGYMFQSDGRR